MAHSKFHILHPGRPGALLLITVLIIGSVALVIALSVALRGVGELWMAFEENQTLETLAVDDGCAQEALIRLSRNHGYTGGTLTIGDGTCTITVTGTGNDRTITVTATIDRWTRSFTIRIRFQGARVKILDWEHTTS